MNSGDVWCPNCMRYHASLMSGHYGTAQLVDIINHYGIAQRQAGRDEERQAMRQRYEEWSEGREKGAYEQGRQAGREEMLDAVTESLDSSYAKGVADTDAHYAELVEAAREVSRWITLYAVGPGIVEVSVKIAKALRDLDEGRRG